MYKQHARDVGNLIKEALLAVICILTIIIEGSCTNLGFEYRTLLSLELHLLWNQVKTLKLYVELKLKSLIKGTSPGKQSSAIPRCYGH